MKPNTHIVFLRGIMPTGKNRAPMADIRRILSEAGFEETRTWIQSGNIALKSPLSACETANAVHNLIKQHIGADLAAITKSRGELLTIIKENPFDNGYDISRVFFTLFNDVPDGELVEKLLSEDFSPERLVITSNAAYMFIPGTYGRGRLSNNFLEKKLKITATTRNFNTLSKMIEISEK